MRYEKFGGKRKVECAIWTGERIRYNASWSIGHLLSDDKDSIWHGGVHGCFLQLYTWKYSEVNITYCLWSLHFCDVGVLFQGICWLAPNNVHALGTKFSKFFCVPMWSCDMTNQNADTVLANVQNPLQVVTCSTWLVECKCFVDKIILHYDVMYIIHTCSC